jgi:Trm5-related predicted tRNA methylase
MKIQTNSKKPKFWKEKSVEDVVTLGPTAQATPLDSENVQKVNLFLYLGRESLG